MSKQVTITTKTAGTNFAVVGVVKSAAGRTLHKTEPKPAGMTANAYRAAEAWAEEHGYTVVVDADAE